MPFSADDRRIFFRIDSELTLEYAHADTFHLNQRDPESYFPHQRHDIELFAQLNRLDKEAAVFMTTIAEQNRAVAEYLRLMNRKTDLVARRLLSIHHSQQEAEPQQVNLSEGGLAFVSHKAFYKDSHIALQLRFMEDYSTIACYAKIIRCDAKDEKHFHIACRFTHMEDIKQDVIARHIMLQQRNARRRQINEQ